MSNTKKDNNLAKKLKRARKEMGLSQKELASALKVSDKSVSSYEVGRAVPSFETLREISHLTYKPITFFIEEDASQDIEVAAKIERIERELLDIKELLKKKSTG